jgi:two-component system nitrogen regulation response regulator NtrX
LKSNPIAVERQIKSTSNKILRELMSYHWPGNIRELRNVVERAIIKCRGTSLSEIEIPSSAPGKLRGAGLQAASGALRLPLKEFLRRAEREYLESLLSRNAGAIAVSAGHAMIDAATLHRKMKSHGLRREEFRG